MNDAEPPTPTSAKSLQVWLFEMVLRSLGNGHVPYVDVHGRLRRLLATGTPPAELLEILQRRHASEPLPDTALGLFDVVNAAARGQVGDPARATTPTPDMPAEPLASRDSTLEPADTCAAADASGTRNDELLRKHEHGGTEICALRDSLAARDATIAELRQALQESGNRLSELQAAHATALSTLDAHSRTGAGLAAELQAAVARADTLSLELTASRESLAARADLQALLGAAEDEKAHLATTLAMRDQALLEAQELANRDAQTIARIQGEQVEQIEQIAQLRAEVSQHAREAAAQTALLKESRRQIQAFDEENPAMTARLERARAVREEHPFVIRRPERSPRGNEDGSVRLQATAERLNSVRRPTAPEAVDRAAELIRIDGEETTTYVLSKRTCIGRAPDCDLQIDSSSVSRRHAVVIVGPRSTVIEDLNSTNGVRVNGRKVMRHVLANGDALTIGDTQFRYFARMQDAPLMDSPAGRAHSPSPTP